MANNKITTITLLLTLLVTSGCLKNGLQDSNKNMDIFHFETTNICQVDINLALNDYSIIVELYAENPLNERGERMSETTPLLRSMTDRMGVIDDVVDLPKSLTKVYLYTEYLGVTNLIEVEIKDKSIIFDITKGASDVKNATRSNTKSTYTKPSNVMVLGDWDASGVPTYLNKRVTLPANLFYNISGNLPKYSNGSVSGAFKYLNQGNDTDLKVVKDAEVDLVFVNETASMKNSICYFHYPTGQKPTNPKDIKMILAFPNLSFPDNTPINKNNGLSSGDNVRLKYWDGTKFSEIFPAGTSIGLVIMTNSFKNSSNVEEWVNYYSTSELNTSETNIDNREHVIIMHEKRTDIFVYMIEDRPRTGFEIAGLYPGGDFHDATLYFKATPTKSIDDSNVGELADSEMDKPIEEKNFTEYSGTLIFEDLWPSEGDYDMNDVVLGYHSKVYRNGENRVIKIVDEYTVAHKGGSTPCGFGYQLNSNKDYIKSVNITPTASGSAADEKGLEVNQAKNSPCVIIFGNILEQKIGNKYVATVEFSTPQDQRNIIPPYNPFIILNERGKEVHLTGYKPTTLANTALFGEADDMSSIKDNKYYISKNQFYPFALKVPTTNFKIPKEKQRIDIAYPKFKEWVTSGGKTNNDWYL